MDTPPLRTPQQAAQWLDGHGVTQAEFARRHGIGYQSLRNLLCGRNKGKWGDAHRAAVLLGMKPAPQGQHPLDDPNSPPT